MNVDILSAVAATSKDYYRMAAPQTPPRQAPQEDAPSPRVWGPFCEAFSLTHPEDECARLAHVSVFFTLLNGREFLFGHFCDTCWANPNLHPNQPFRVRQVEGWHPRRRR